MLTLLDNRVKIVQERLSKENIDALLVTCWENKRYLTGFSGSTSWVLVTPDRCAILVDGRYTVQAAEECPACVERVHVTDFVDGFPKELTSTLNQPKIKRIGVEARNMSLLEARRIEENANVILVSTTGWIESLRAKKTPDEIDLLKKSVVVAEKACQKALAGIAAGVEEIQVANIIIDYLNRNGHKESFETIVASGERSAMPHGRPTSRKIQKGDPVVVDMGALVQGYHSDITRTVCLGEPDEEKKKVFELLQKAQEAAYKVIRPGAACKDVDCAARKIIHEAGFGENFSHGLGHGIGLEIHEAPTLRKTSDQVLEPGMVITVEPGVYIPGKFGMRLEDDVLVTETGYELLSTLPQKLKI